MAALGTDQIDKLMRMRMGLEPQVGQMPKPYAGACTTASTATTLLKAYFLLRVAPSTALTWGWALFTSVDTRTT